MAPCLGANTAAKNKTAKVRTMPRLSKRNPGHFTVSGNAVKPRRAALITTVPVIATINAASPTPKTPN